MDLPPEAQALLALPPARFTSERNALAAALAARRDPAAARVRKLARPIGLAWLLNRLARERPREVEALLAAGDAVRAGQRRAVSGAGSGALREAEGALRERARALRLEGERLVAAEGRPAPPALARLELLLRLAATGTDREAFREGALGREPAPWGGELSGFELVAGGKGAAPSRAPPARRGGAAEPAALRARRGREERAERERAERERRDEERELRDRARALAKARAAAAQASRRAEREERAAGEAERRAREARERAAAARAEAARAAVRVLELQRKS